MLNRDAISLQSLFSVVNHADLNYLGRLRANQSIGQAGVSADLDLQSGKLRVRDHVLSFPDIGGNIEFGMVYVDQAESAPWQLCATRAIKEIAAGQQITVREPDGSVQLYQYHNGKYEFADHDGIASIHFDEDTQTYCWCHAGKRVTEYFSKENNQVSSSINAQGLVTEYKYQGNKLDYIIAPSKLQYRFAYQDNAVMVTRKSGDDEILLHSYYMNADNCLEKSLTRDGYEIKYQYENKTKLISVNQTDKTECHFLYYTEGTDKDKIKMLCMGDKAQNALSLHYEQLDTRVILPSGEALQYTFNELQQLVNSNSSDQSYQYEFYPNRQIKAVHYPDKSSEMFEYDAVTGLLVRHTKRDGSIDEFEYANDAEPVLLRLSQYVAGANKPSQTKRYVYKTGKNQRKQLCFEISSSGSVCEYKHNELGLICLIKHYLTAKYEKEITPNDLEMKEWLDSLSAIKRFDKVNFTTFDYHANGQIKRKAEYSALLSDGKVDVSKPYKESLYEKDLNGNTTLSSMLTEKNNPSYLKTRHEFDSLNRLLEVVEGAETAAQQITKRECKQEKIIEKAANGQVQQLTLNTAGLMQNEFTELRDQAKIQVHFTKVVRNLAKKVRVTSHSDLTNEFEYLDATGRLVGQVGKSGQVIKIEYNEACRYQKKTAFANKVNASVAELSEAWSEPVANAEEDRQSYTFYGLNNEVNFEVDADGYLVEYRYHLNKIAHVIRYSDRVKDTELAKLLSGIPISREPNRHTDRIQSTFYDEDGHVLAEQDGAGYIQEYQRDAGGRPVTKISYANPVMIFTDNYELAKPGQDVKHDAKNYYFHNNLNQCEMEVDALGYVTTREYDLDGQLKWETRHATPINLSLWDNKSSKPVVIPSDNDHVESYEYDELRRLKIVSNTNGELRQYAYDAMNHQTSVTQEDLFSSAKSGDFYRGKELRFNQLGQVIASLNPFGMQKLALVKEQLKSTALTAAVSAIWDKYAENYEYDIHGLKIKTTDPLGKITRHYYDKDRNLVLTIDPTGAVSEFEYNTFGEEVAVVHLYQRISASELAKLNGGFINEQVRKCCQYDEKNDYKLTKPRDKRGLEKSITETGINPTCFTYNAFKQVDTEERVGSQLNLIKIKHEYEGRGLEIAVTKSTTDEEPIVTKAEYQHALGLKTADVDANNGRHEYVRNGLGWVTEERKRDEDDKMVVIKQATHDAFAREINVTTADNETLEINYDDHARKVTVILADGLSKKVTYKNVFNEVIRTQYYNHKSELIFDSKEEHAPDGQVCVHQDGEGNQTSHEINILGLKGKTILPNQSILSFGYNDAHVLNKQIIDEGEDKLNLTAEFTIDALKRQESKTDARKNKSRFEYTPQGEYERVITELDGGKKKLITQNIRDAVGNINFIQKGDDVKGDVLKVKNERDGFDRVTAEVTAPGKLDIKKQFAHDKLDRVIKTSDPMGYVSRKYYNVMDKLRYELKPVNKSYSCLIERRYSTAGKLIEYRIRRLPISVNAINDETSLNEIKQSYPGTNQDQITRYYYAKDGKSRFKLQFIYNEKEQRHDARVTEKEYDAVGRVTKRRIFEKKLPVSNLETLTSESISTLVNNPAFSNAQSDRIIYRQYDLASRCRFETNQDGFVTEKIYDAMGKVITIKEYEDHANNPTKFRCKHAIYDAVGNEIFNIGTNGELIRTDYDANGNPVQICRFKTPIDNMASYEEVVKAAKNRKPDNLVDSIKIKAYDSANRLVSVTDELGNVDTYVLNAVGNVEHHIDRNNQDHETQFDAAQRKIRQLSPETSFVLVSENDGKLSYEKKRAKIAKFFDLNANGQAKRIIAAEGIKEVERVVDMDYNAVGSLAEVSVPNAEVANNKLDSQAEGVDIVTVNKQTIVNEQGLPVAECDEDGKWNYYLRDAFGRVIYTVLKQQLLIAHQYNGFGLEAVARKFNTPFLDKNWELFRNPSKALEALKLASDHPFDNLDRITKTEYFPSGKMKSKTTSSIPYYDEGVFGEAEPVTKMRYNRFGELVYEAKLLSPGKWAENLTWRDQAGRPVLHVDEKGYVIHYQRDVFGNVEIQTEYANALSSYTSASLDILLTKSVGEVLKEVTQDSQLDRIYMYGYNQRGDKVSEKLLDVKACELVVDSKQAPRLIEIMRTSVGKRFEISKTQKCLKVVMECISPDGTKEEVVLEENQYDERDIKVGSLGSMRGQEDFTTGIKKPIRPLTKILPNAHGETAAKQISPEGGELKENHSADFVKEAKIIEEIYQHNLRGHKAASQDGAGTLSKHTYTGTGQPAASTINDKKFVKEGEGKVSKQTEVKKTKKALYNDFGGISSQHHIANGVIEQELFNAINHFGEEIGSGVTRDELAAFQKRNAAGRVWMDNLDEGAAKIRMQDLQGNQTGTLSADAIDLSNKSPADIPALLKDDRKVVLLEEFGRDKAGILQNYKAPFSYAFPENKLPTFSQNTDAWRNVVSKTDSNGYTTNLAINKQDSVVKETKPETDVTQEDGMTVKREKPTTQYGYNPVNALIGKINPRGYCEGYRLDEANQLIERILANGVLEKRFTYDAMGRIRIVFNSSDGSSTYEYDNNSNVISLTLPRGGTFEYRYDLARNRVYVKSPDGVETRLNYSMAGDVVERFSHFGHLTRMIYNHRHQLLEEANPDGTYRKWTRDFFGVVSEHTDLTKRITTFQRNYNRKVIRETTANSPALDQALLRHGYIAGHPGASQQPITLQHIPAESKPNLEANIGYGYEYGQLKEIDDITGNKRTELGVNSDGKRDMLKVMQRDDGMLLRLIKQTHDELQRKKLVTDRNNLFNNILNKAEVLSRYDANSNVKSRDVSVERPRYRDGVAQIDSGSWLNAFNQNDQATVLNGGLVANQVRAVPGRGSEHGFDPKTGQRNSELMQDLSAGQRTASIERDAEHAIAKIKPNTKINEERLRSKGGVMNRREFRLKVDLPDPIPIPMPLPLPQFYNITDFETDEAGLPKHESVFDNVLAAHMGADPKLWSDTKYKNSDAGNTIEATTTLNLDHATTEQHTSEFIMGKEAPLVVSEEASMRNRHGENYSNAKFGFNNNIEPVYKQGWDDESSPFSVGPEYVVDGMTFTDKMTDGTVLNKLLFKMKTLVTNPKISVTSLAAVKAPILDVEGNAEAIFRVPVSVEDNAANKPISVNQHFPLTGHIAEEASYTSPNDEPRDFKLQFTKASPARVPLQVTIQTGDTLEALARLYYGHERYAEDIAERNGFMTVAQRKLAAGSILFMPEITADRLQYDAAMPYYMFASKIIGQISAQTSIPMPKVHHPNFFGQFVKMVALALVVAFAPEMVNFVIPGLLGTDLAIASAVVAGLSDAAIQGLAIGLGVQEKFSSAEVLETAVSAGVASGKIEGLKLGPELDPMVQAANVMKVASIQVATQLTEMTLGARDKFDPRAIGEQVIASLAAVQISAKLSTTKELNPQTPAGKVAIRVANTAVNATIAAATHTPINIQQATMAAISSLASDEIGSYVQNQTEQTSFVNDYGKPELVKIGKPGLELPGPAYGEVSYGMGVLNQVRMESERASHVSLSQNHNLNQNAKPLPQNFNPGVSHHQAKENANYYKIHDQTNFELGLMSSIFKGLPIGMLVDDVNTTRTQLRTMVYGSKEDRIQAGKGLAVDAAVGVAVASGVGLVGYAADFAAEGLLALKHSVLPSVLKEAGKFRFFGGGGGGVESNSIGLTTRLAQTGSGVNAGLADDFYNAIRINPKDIYLIAKNTGIKPSNIQKVKNHLFHNEHLLDRYVDYGVPAEIKRFDSDISIAHAWRRLVTGNHTQQDVQLLKHEAAEAWYMRKNGPSYSAAHSAADKRYPAPALEEQFTQINSNKY